MSKEYPVLQPKLDFYAMGKIETSNISPKPFNKNMSIPDSSANILNRNKFSVNSSDFDNVKNEYGKLHSLNELKNKELNNYLSPLNQLTHSEK